MSKPTQAEVAALVGRLRADGPIAGAGALLDEAADVIEALAVEPPLSAHDLRSGANWAQPEPAEALAGEGAEPVAWRTLIKGKRSQRWLYEEFKPADHWLPLYGEPVAGIPVTEQIQALTNATPSHPAPSEAAHELDWTKCPRCAIAVYVKKDPQCPRCGWDTREAINGNV